MLYNGEQHRRRLAARGRHRRRPARGHDAVRRGHAQRARHDRAVRAGHDVRPGPVRLHAEDGHLARHARTCSTSTARSAETLELMAEGEGHRRGRRGGDRCSTARATRRRSSEIREAGARIRLIPHGDVSAALLAVTEGSPVDLLWGIGGTPEGVLSAAAIKCIGGKIARPPVAARRRGAPGRARRRLRPRRGARRRPPGVRATTSSSPPPASPTATCSTGVALHGPAGRHHRVARDALALGHGAPRQRPPRPREAARDHRRARRLSRVAQPRRRPPRRSVAPAPARPPPTAPGPAAPASAGRRGSR